MNPSGLDLARVTPKRIVLTGCTRGLGRAMARYFAAAGHVVLGCGRSQTELDRLQGELGQPHDFAAVDVSEDAQVQSWAHRLLSQGEAPDLLLNNAAAIAANAPLWRVSAEDFARVMDVNVKGVAHVIRHFTPAMIARKRGVIVNFSSGWGRSVSADVAPYCASKWAIEGLTKALADELPRGLTAVALNPGIIDTEMLQSCFGSDAASYEKPEDWVERAGPFLLSLDARQNGGSLTVPG